jgi:hypothetical protein
MFTKFKAILRPRLPSRSQYQHQQSQSNKDQGGHQVPTADSSAAVKTPRTYQNVLLKILNMK